MSSTITSIITSRNQYPKLLAGLKDLSEPEQIAKLRNLCKTDLFFLLVYGLGRQDAQHDWVFQRCREVQASPNGHLDLWAREHYKSTIITFAGSIFDILNDPEVTIGIFSHTKPIAKGFMRQIKYELESNERLKRWFPDVLWTDPRKESPKWTEDEGIVVRRKGNPKECTVEAWGLVDGQPTSKHFRLRVYDDVVTRESVTTPEMMKKTTEALELSDNLGTEDGFERMAGTRYHFGDTYGTCIKRGSFKVRIHPCTYDGTENFTADNCVLMQPETLAKKRRDQGPYTFGTQMLLNPKGDEAQTFKTEWLRYTGASTRAGLNVYIVVDPANEKRSSNDYTCMWVVGLGPDKNYVVLDVIRDRMNLTERTNKLFDLHAEWMPIAVGYEKYGMQADIQHIRHVQEERNYRFDMIELAGSTPKMDRIKRLIPLFEDGRIFLRRNRNYTDYQGDTKNLIDVFVEEEYKAFPVMMHDDMLDCLARIVDPQFPVQWPKQGGFKSVVVNTKPPQQRQKTQTRRWV